MIRAKNGTQEYWLVKLKNVASPWNNQVFVTLERPGGSGKDYVAFVDQREWNVVIERDGYYEAFPKDVKETLRLAVVSIDRGQKSHPTLAEVTSDFTAPPAAAPKR